MMRGGVEGEDVNNCILCMSKEMAEANVNQQPEPVCELWKPWNRDVKNSQFVRDVFACWSWLWLLLVVVMRA